MFGEKSQFFGALLLIFFEYKRIKFCLYALLSVPYQQKFISPAVSSSSLSQARRWWNIKNCTRMQIFVKIGDTVLKFRSLKSSWSPLLVLSYCPKPSLVFSDSIILNSKNSNSVIVWLVKKKWILKVELAKILKSCSNF